MQKIEDEKIANEKKTKQKYAHAETDSHFDFENVSLFSVGIWC